MNSNANQTAGTQEALRFWEPHRLLYNAILTGVVFFWLVLTWPHFRPSLTLGSLEAFLFLALAANLCYCAAYLLEIFIQTAVNITIRRRLRRTLFVVGTLFALLLENYWISDEIYPYANQPPRPLIGGTIPMPQVASNMNFPAPLAVLGFLSAAILIFCGMAAALILWFSRKPRVARTTISAIAAAACLYLGLVLTFSVASHTRTLARGQEKYFCEIDCHLAYSITDAEPQSDGRYRITLRTRFDEATISPARPKDATLTPAPREVRLIDSFDREYAPTTVDGTPLLTPLKPGDAYTTELEFHIPKYATGLRLLIKTTPAWPDHFVIGDENSWLHKKTYFSLGNV
jgi:hypothetical protein